MSQTLPVDGLVLEGVVRAITGDYALTLDAWEAEPLTYESLSPSSVGLYRVKGEQPQPWSVIAKVSAAPADPALGEAWHPQYWRREAYAYQSGLFGSMPPGFTVPVCYDINTADDGAVWLWLEDLELADEPWSLERRALAARHLGRFQGMYLVEWALPDASWLSRDLARSMVAGYGEMIETACDPRVWNRALLRDAFPKPHTDRLMRLWQERDAFFDALAYLPQTLCHHDYWRENLFSRPGPDGESETVVIDWEMVGYGAAGEDAGNLMAASLLNYEIDASEADELADLMLIGYLTGLQDSGWRGDPQPIRFAFQTAALRTLFPMACWPVAIALDDSGQYVEHTERRWGLPIDQIFGQWASVTEFLLDRMDEARRYLGWTD